MSLTCRMLCIVTFVVVGHVPASGGQAPAGEKPSPGGAEPAKGATHEVKEQPFRIAVSLKGVFQAREAREIALVPEAWSELVVVKAVAHGARVKKGAPLVSFDCEKIDKAIADLEASQKLGRLAVRQAEVELAALERSHPLDVATLERTTRQSQEDLDRFLESGRALTKKRAEFSLQYARNSLEYQQEELRQLEKMYLADDLTEETEEIILKRQRDAVKSAAFRLELAEVDHEETLSISLPRREVSFKDAASKQKLALEKSRVALTVALQKGRLELEKLKRDHARSSDRLRELQRDRRLMTVKSPCDGVVYFGRCVQGTWSDSTVAGSKLRSGATVQPKDVILTVVQPRPLLIRAMVPEKELGHLRGGVQGSAVPTGFPGMKLSATLQEVSAIPTSPGNFSGVMRVDLNERTRALMPGMTCQVELVAYSKKKAIAIPAGALFPEEGKDGESCVYVRKADGAVDKRRVTPGRRSEKSVEILRGLKAGEVVLLEKPREEA